MQGLSSLYGLCLDGLGWDELGWDGAGWDRNKAEERSCGKRKNFNKPASAGLFSINRVFALCFFILSYAMQHRHLIKVLTPSSFVPSDTASTLC